MLDVPPENILIKERLHPGSLAGASGAQGSRVTIGLPLSAT